MARFFCLTLALTLLLAPRPASAWGAMGHRLVAQLAADELTPAARDEVARLLAGEPEPTLVGIASWADELRDRQPELGRRTGRWHFVNLGEHGCGYEGVRDCRDDNCVIAAIQAQAAILADHAQPLAARREALKFVVHFVGDVHQPLHAGYARDKGGNTVQLRLEGAGTNLHALWDSKLIRSAGLDEPEYLAQLRALPLVVPVPSPVLPPDAVGWAQQSCRIVLRPGLYPASAKIGVDYLEAWRPLADEQLRRAGSRLVTLLNAALAP